MTNAKLVTITREDLTNGQQSVQSCHAAIDFIFQHPSRASPWHEESNYLVQLVAKDEQHLLKIIASCQMRMIDYTIFREPDLNNEITAIALEPSIATQKITSSLPLLFKSKN